MNNQKWIGYNIRIGEALQIFALKLPKLSGMFPASQRGRILNNLLTSSEESIGVNYRAVLRKRQKTDYFAKGSITVENDNETETLPGLTIGSGIVKRNYMLKARNC